MELFKLTIEEFDDLYKKYNSQLIQQTKELAQQYKDCVTDENLTSFDSCVTKIFSSNKSFLHERLKVNFSKKDYSYLIDKAEVEIKKINQEIMAMRKLYVTNNSSLQTQSQHQSIIFQNSQLKSQNTINSLPNVVQDSILKLPTAKLVKLNQKEIEQRLRETMRYKVMNSLVVKIQKAFRRYLSIIKPKRNLAAKKIQKSYRHYKVISQINQEGKLKYNAAKTIQMWYRKFKQNKIMQKNKRMCQGLDILLEVFNQNMAKKYFRQILKYSLVRLRIETRAYQVYKLDPHRVHLNNVDHEELKKIIPEEGKYKMSSVFWDFILKSKVYYKWLLFAALRRKRAAQKSQN
ncbi:hypothetical protein ABPG72_001209 [Tetrahymena utriculariae]